MAAFIETATNTRVCTLARIRIQLVTDVLRLTNKICAIRETFEESGLLLTYPPATSIQDKHVWRERVHNDASQFKVLCETHGLVPAVDRLTPFANWITPGAEKRRYNTHFFLTVWTPDSVAQADGTETVQLDWFSPKEALEQWRQRGIVLFPPQWYSLESMVPIQDHVNLTAHAGIGALRTSNGNVSTVMPQHNPVNDPTWSDRGYHTFLAYPGDEYYLDLVHGQPTGGPGDRHRIYIRGRMEDFELEKNVNVPEQLTPSSSSTIKKASL